MDGVTEQQLIRELVAVCFIDDDMLADWERDTGGIPRSRHVTRLEELVRQGRLDKEQLIPLVREKFPLLTADQLMPDRKVIGIVPYKYASYYQLLPLRIEKDSLVCAVANPFDMHMLHEIETVLGRRIEPVWAFQEDIAEAMKSHYGLGAAVGQPAMPNTGQGVSAGISQARSDASVTLVEELLLDAARKRATDIHIEPMESRERIRYRIDGLLYDQNLSQAFVTGHETVVARLKVLANLNLADKRKPQDGRIKTVIGDQEFDLRISILPTEFGETVDIRLLSKEQIDLGLGQLGFSESDLSAINGALSKQHGIILVTGPTGSGKTTTLYSCLKQLNTPERKIITIEDPIEYQLDNITQLQVHPQIDFTFANGLRSMLRHDPDIMMVGEIRDPETAKIAIQVALTGHLVLSTLHTNDSVSALTRLQDMGVERYLMTSTLETVVAPRLVRRICDACKREADISHLDIDFPTFIGEGCSRCGYTGFRGRVGVFEIFQIDLQFSEMIVSRQPPPRIREKALDKGMTTLFDSGMDKVRKGITSYSEVLRVLQQTTEQG
jgi:type II secretory ATPase GspE/PulE/Tfp pilus assembly ATPase PilB-like protein